MPFLQNIFLFPFGEDTIACPVSLVPKQLVTSNSNPPLTGDVAPGATVTVTVRGVEYSAVNNGDGTWSIADGIIGNGGSPQITASAHVAGLASGFAGDADEGTHSHFTDSGAPVVGHDFFALALMEVAALFTFELEEEMRGIAKFNVATLPYSPVSATLKFDVFDATTLDWLGKGQPAHTRPASGWFINDHPTDSFEGTIDIRHIGGDGTVNDPVNDWGRTPIATPGSVTIPNGVTPGTSYSLDVTTAYNLAKSGNGWLNFRFDMRTLPIATMSPGILFDNVRLELPAETGLPAGPTPVLIKSTCPGGAQGLAMGTIVLPSGRFLADGNGMLLTDGSGRLLSDHTLG